MKIFCAIGFFNEADIPESSSILIYSLQKQSIYTQNNVAQIKGLVISRAITAASLQIQ
jgi:hypothetical protein